MFSDDGRQGPGTVTGRTPTNPQVNAHARLLTPDGATWSRSEMVACSPSATTRATRPASSTTALSCLSATTGATEPNTGVCWLGPP